MSEPLYINGERYWQKEELLARPLDEYTFERGEIVYPLWPRVEPSNRFKVLRGGMLSITLRSVKYEGRGLPEHEHAFYEDSSHYARAEEEPSRG